jgi:hypothetical protein
LFQRKSGVFSRGKVFLQAAAENFKKGLTRAAGAGIIPGQNRGKKKTHQKEALCN